MDLYFCVFMVLGHEVVFPVFTKSIFKIQIKYNIYYLVYNLERHTKMKLDGWFVKSI